MAAKKIQEFVSSKIGNTHLETGKECDSLKGLQDSNEGKTVLKSSSDTKNKLESHITDADTNINTIEDSNYVLITDTVLNKEIVENCNLIENNEGNVGAMKSADIKSQENDIRNVKNDTLKDGDCTDFNWLPIPKTHKNLKKRKDPTEMKTDFPREIQQSLIQNYKFPLTRLRSFENFSSSNRNTKLLFVVGATVVFISIISLSINLFIGFLMGAATCYILLTNCGLVALNYEKNIMSLPALKDLPSPSIPFIEETNESDLDMYASKESNYSCWVNIIETYDASTYNINQCNVVHLDIEDKALRIRRSNKRIPHRVMWNDPLHRDIIFISEIVIELNNVILDLLPIGLIHKRLWSKKYPICIQFSRSLSEYVTDLSFSDILNLKSQQIIIFGRSCREKEELFRRLLNTSSDEPVNYSMWNIVLKYLTKSSDTVEMSKLNSLNKAFDTTGRNLTFKSESEDDNTKVKYNNGDDEDDQEALRLKSENSISQIGEYIRYMAKFMPSDMFLLTTRVMHLDINYVTCNPELLCINALLGRVFWDFLRGSHWNEIVRNKIQCKLKKIHLPQMMDELIVVDINFGKEIPIIRKVSRPYLDSRGLWFDLDIAYTGGFSMILETKVNLFNLRNQIRKSPLNDEKRSSESPIINNDLIDDNSEHVREKRKCRSQSNTTVLDKTAAFISSEEDSAESSSYSEDSGDEKQNLIPGPPHTSSGGGSSKRLVRWVDKIARSPYFIIASDNKYIQRGMELVSNTKLMLQVELHNISGTLAINVPPPPSDRIWFGFRPSPIIKLSAKPKVGQTEISISKITDLIEKKLILEFQRVLVLPNMDDIHMPLLVNGSLKKYISSYR